MGIAFAPASNHHFTYISYIISIGVFEEYKIRCHGDQDTAIDGHDRSGDIQFICKNSDFISFAITICVFEYFDFVVATFSANLIRIIYCFDHIQSALLVPSHGHRIDDHGLASKQFHFKFDR